MHLLRISKNVFLFMCSSVALTRLSLSRPSFHFKNSKTDTAFKARSKSKSRPFNKAFPSCCSSAATTPFYTLAGSSKDAEFPEQALLQPPNSVFPPLPVYAALRHQRRPVLHPDHPQGSRGGRLLRASPRRRPRVGQHPRHRPHLHRHGPLHFLGHVPYGQLREAQPAFEHHTRASDGSRNTGDLHRAAPGWEPAGGDVGVQHCGLLLRVCDGPGTRAQHAVLW
jgi:hypothetical protein